MSGALPIDQPGTSGNSTAFAPSDSFIPRPVAMEGSTHNGDVKPSLGVAPPLLALGKGVEALDLGFMSPQLLRKRSQSTAKKLRRAYVILADSPD